MKYFKNSQGEVFGFEDDDLNINTEELTPINETERDNILKFVPSDEDQAEAVSRAVRAEINSLTVEVDGLTFKANDKSQGRMMGAILDAQTTGDTSTVWKMADGSKQTVTLEQLKTAQSLAIRAVGALVVV